MDEKRYERFIVAATKLKAGGLTPTLKNVRERVGSGSYRDIVRAMELWRHGEVVVPDFLPAMPEALRAQAVELWNEACRRAEAVVADERRAIAEASRDVQARVDERDELVQVIEAERDRALETCAELQKQCALLKEQVGRLEAASAPNADGNKGQRSDARQRKTGPE